jgi:hypothetical protein
VYGGGYENLFLNIFEWMLEVGSKFIVAPTRWISLQSLLIKGEVQSSVE